MFTEQDAGLILNQLATAVVLLDTRLRVVEANSAAESGSLWPGVKRWFAARMASSRRM